MISFNYHIQYLIENSKNILKFLRKEKKIHCRSIFLQGLLINLNHQRKKYFLSWKAVFDKFNNWIRNNKPNHLSACLSFVFANKYLDKIIIGVNTKKKISKKYFLQKIYEKKIFPKFGTRDKKLLNPVNWKL